MSRARTSSERRRRASFGEPGGDGAARIAGLGPAELDAFGRGGEEQRGIVRRRALGHGVRELLLVDRVAHLQRDDVTDRKGEGLVLHQQADVGPRAGRFAPDEAVAVELVGQGLGEGVGGDGQAFVE